MRYTKQNQDGSGINLSKAMAASRVRKAVVPSEWFVHTPYHWSRMVNDKRLDYWPSKDKWMYEGKTMVGDVDDFIKHVSTRESLK